MNIHPCSKEFQDTAKHLGLTGNELIQKLKREGILKTDYKVNQERMNNFAKNRNYTDFNAYQRDLYNKNRDFFVDRLKQYYYAKNGSPMRDNPDCNLNFGIIIGEKLFNRFLPFLFSKVEWLALSNYHKGNINYIVSDPRKEFLDTHPHFKPYFRDNRIFTVALMNRCIDDREQWGFNINYNASPDFFLLCGWSKRKDRDIYPIYPIKTWLFPRNIKVRKGHSQTNKIEFWRRKKLVITNVEKYCSIFNKNLIELSFQNQLIDLWKEMDTTESVQHAI